MMPLTNKSIMKLYSLLSKSPISFMVVVWWYGRGSMYVIYCYYFT